MTLNAICRECNQGWLESLEEEATEVIHEVTASNSKPALSEREVRVLGFWAYVRALVLTHVYPRGRVPSEFFETTYAARDSRAIPNGSYVSLGASTYSIFEAGVVQAARMRPGNHYFGFVGFGLGGLVFLVAVSDASPETSELAREIIEAPRLWFPHRLRRLNPVELPVPRTRAPDGRAGATCMPKHASAPRHRPATRSAWSGTRYFGDSNSVPR